MTDQELSTLIDVSREYVRLLRHGKRVPSPTILARIVLATAGLVDAEDFIQSGENV